ncbi:MAG: sulfatase-like hydrolase/transferase [Verrucomicrobiota bacterium]
MACGLPDDGLYTNEGWPQPEKNKAAMITRLDAYVGQILDQLVTLKIHTNTIVIFTSDNGPHSEGGVKAEFHKSSGPFRGIKRDLYEGGIRVPAIAWWPARTPRGQVSSLPWAHCGLPCDRGGHRDDQSAAGCGWYFYLSYAG